jgi:hypothetical protein
MFLLSLIACLAGTPLRQAEAAHDLSRSIDELDGGALVEEVDGGVGDDAHVAVKGSVADVPIPDLSPSAGWPLAIFSPIAVRGPDPIRAAEAGPPPPDLPGRRLARLQRFRC